jgi:hypothetical protein
MSSNDLFLRASRLRLRFPSVVGLLSVEDLWNLPLISTTKAKPSIENIGADLLDQQSKLKGGSILRNLKPSKETSELDLSIEILRVVANILQDEAEAKTLAAAKRSERERLESIIAERESKEAPLDDLKARLALLSN